MIIIILAGFRGKKIARARAAISVDSPDWSRTLIFSTSYTSFRIRTGHFCVRDVIFHMYTHIYICIREPKVFVNRYLRTEMFRKNVFSLFVIYLIRDYFEFESCLKNFFSIERIDEYRI